MEVLLLEDIPGVGKINDIIVVKEGFALNNLLPRRRAIVATPTVRRRYAEQIRRRAEEKVKEMEMKKSAAGSLSGANVLIEKKATKTGKLYAAITEKLIAEALKEQLKTDVPEDAIDLSEPIKSVGEHKITITLGEDKADVNIEVKGEDKE